MSFKGHIRSFFLDDECTHMLLDWLYMCLNHIESRVGDNNSKEMCYSATQSKSILQKLQYVYVILTTYAMLSEKKKKKI